MTLAATLFQLEQLDSDLEQREAELRDARKRLAANPQLAAAEARLEVLRSQERMASTEQRRIEADLTDVEAKIKRDQTRMYSGQIVDPRELASLERELEHYGHRRSELEEHCLESMEQVEDLQRQMADASRQVAELRDRWESSRPELTRQIEQLTDRLAGIHAERERVAGSIDPRSLDQYGRLRRSLGHAVSHISGGVCQWCRVAIPPKDVQHARGDVPATCSNCGRILYAG
jgi:predicted  nucleic acid-binding Zn-ribbon protein